MGLKLRRSAASLRTYRRNFFRRRHRPEPSTIKLLQDIYPNVDWRRVRFYEGLPWFTPPVAPYVTAQALPHFYSFGGFCIYLKRFDETRAQCLADIIHEAYHVMQAMKFGRGYGIGFLRGWMIYYLAEFVKHGYRKNAFEVPAYNQEFRFLSYCLRLGIRGMISQVKPGAFDNISNERELVFPTFSYRYKGSFFTLIGSFFVCVAITIVKPVADLALFVFGTPLVLRRAAKARGSTTPYHGSGKTPDQGQRGERKSIIQG
jgi:hypothetical protein